MQAWVRGRGVLVRGDRAVVASDWIGREGKRVRVGVRQDGGNGNQCLCRMLVLDSNTGVWVYSANICMDADDDGI